MWPTVRPLVLLVSLLLPLLSAAGAARGSSTRIVGGTVLDPGGEPVEGATVAAVWLEESLPGAFAIPAVQEFFGAALYQMAEGVARAETDSEGAFELEVPEDRDLGLTVLAEGLAPLRVHPASFAGPATLRLDRGATSRVRVLDAEGGEPLAGALVVARQGEPGVPAPEGKASDLVHRVEARTDKEGWVSMPGLAHSSYQLRAKASGRIPVDEISFSGGATLRVLMLPGARLSGQVIDERGEPVEEGTVSVAALLAPEDDPNPRGVAFGLRWQATGMRVVRDETRTDAEGLFRFEGLPPGATARVVVQAPGFSGLAESIEQAAEGEETAVSLVLPPTFPLSVGFVDEEGRAVEGVSVRLQACRDEDAPSPPHWREFRELPLEERSAFQLYAELGDPVRDLVQSRSDESGKVLLQARGRRCQEMSWSIEGFASGRKTIALAGGEVPAEIDTVTLTPTRSLGGRVLDFEGEPVAGLDVWVDRLEEGGGTTDPVETRRLEQTEEVERAAGSSSGTTDEDGRFLIEGVEPGRYQVLVSPGPAGWRHDEAPVVEPGRREIEIGVRGAAVLAGRVLDGGSLDPLEGAWAVVRERKTGGMMGALFGGGEQPAEYPSRVRRDGRFRVGVPPGEYQVQIRKEGYLPGSVTAEARADETTRLEELVLDRGATLQGLVLGPDDLPLAGARVGEADDSPFSLEALERLGPRAEEGPPGLAWTTTRLDGSFLLEGLPPGDLRVRVHHPACAPLDHTVPALGPGEVREGVVLRTHLGGSVEGSYTDGSGDPIAGTFVIAASLQDIAGARTATTDEQGRFRIEKLPAGQHFILGLPPDIGSGVLPVPKMIEVYPGEVTPVSLSTGGGLPVRGAVTLAGAPLAGARVSLVSPSQILPGSAAERPTASDGTFRLTVPSPGDYLAAVEAEDPEISLLREVSVPPGGGTLSTIGLPAPASLEVLVEDSSGEAVPGASVTLWHGETLADLPSWAREETERGRSTDEEGETVFGGLAAGRYRVGASAPGLGSALETGTIREGSERGSVTLVLPGVRSVTGSVLTEEGRPVRQAMLAVLEESGEAPSIHEPGSTDEAGLFELAEVPDRPVLLAVGAQGRGLALVPLDPGGEPPRVVMSPAGGADVQVTGASGERVEVLLSLETPGEIVLPPGTLAGVQILLGGNSIPDREGWVRLRGLEPGRYTLRALREGREVGSASLSIVAHEVIEDRLRVR